MPANDVLQGILGAALAGGTQGPAPPQRALAWARVSSGQQEERGQSIQEQMLQLRQYAAEHEIEIAEEFTEVASAFQRRERRVEFQRMLTRAKSDRQITAILVHDLSRFSRDALQGQVWIQELREAGVRVISLNDPDIDLETSAGAYMGAFTFAKNEAYSRDIAMATRRGCQGNVRVRDPETGWCYTNGGQSLWGYRSVSIRRGMDGRNRPIDKTVWELDTSLAAGRPVHEWVRHVLVELAGQGASLNQMRDFCERTGLQPQRKEHWGASTINAILAPHILAKYAGYGIWGVHDKKGRVRPQTQWVIVPSAHQAIITPEEAQRIGAVRRKATRPAHLQPLSRSRKSPYLLSGGIFRCGRCGANMTGLRGSNGTHYVCGSLPYRRGRGCGPGVYVPVAFIEREVLRELKDVLAYCADPKGFAELVNAELAKLEPDPSPESVDRAKELASIDAKICRVRAAIEDGLEDVEWANGRLRELSAERARLSAAYPRAATAKGKPVRHRVTAKEAVEMRRDIERLFQFGTIAEKKELLRIWIAEMKLAPERREVMLTFRAPEPVMQEVVAGAGFEPATFGL